MILAEDSVVLLWIFCGCRGAADKKAGQPPATRVRTFRGRHWRKLTQQTVLLLSSWLAFSHCPWQNKQPPHWAEECTDALWGWGISLWYRGETRGRQNMELASKHPVPYLVTHWKLPWSLLQKLLSRMKPSDLEGKFRRIFNSEENRKGWHGR